MLTGITMCGILTGHMANSFESATTSSSIESAEDLAGLRGPGRLGAVKRPQRFPMKIHFVWGFCMGAQGA
jgi:hypothetical protein